MKISRICPIRLFWHKVAPLLNTYGQRHLSAYLHCVTIVQLDLTEMGFYSDDFSSVSRNWIKTDKNEYLHCLGRWTNRTDIRQRDPWTQKNYAVASL